MLDFFRRHGWSKAAGPPVPAPLPISNSSAGPGNETPPLRFDPIKWARANPWLAEGQADDRLQVNGAVAAGGGTPAEERSLARRTHQLMFKKWSQARHD